MVEGGGGGEGWGVEGGVLVGDGLIKIAAECLTIPHGN